MKRFVVLSICMLLALAATANATLVPGVNAVNVSDGQIGLQAVVTPTGGGYDIVDIYIASLPTGATLMADFQGTWQAVGGTFYVFNKSDPTNGSYQSNTTYLGLDAGATPGYSAVNFGAAIGGAAWYRDGGATHNTSLLAGGWMDNGKPGDDLVGGTNRVTQPATGTNTDGWANNLLAEMVVTSATTEIDFISGKYGFLDGAGYDNIGVLKTDFVIGGAPITPEPSTLVLLGSGLFGLLAYAWRKRK